MVKVHLYLPEQINAFIRAQAQARGLAYSEMARRVVEKGYLVSVQEMREVHTREALRGPKDED